MQLLLLFKNLKIIKIITLSMSEEFQKVLQVLQRPINCLADDDRNIRLGGLNAINKQMGTLSKQYILKLFHQTKLTVMISKVVADHIENNRKLALLIIELLIKVCMAQAKPLYEQLIPSLIARLNGPEKSQQLKLKLVKIFIQLMAYKDCLYKNLPQLANVLAKCLAEADPQLKYESCQLAKKLSKQLNHEFGKHTTNVILSLRDNLQHNIFKVRRASLQTIGFVLVTDGAGGNFEHIRVNLKKTLSDKKKQVRSTAYECISHLLLFLGPKYMKQYEAILIGFMLMGLDDESPQVIAKVIELLEKCGKKIKQEQQEGVTMESEISNKDESK